MVSGPPWVIEIPGPPPPRPGTKHWRVIHRAKQDWETNIRAAANRQGIPKCPPGQRRIIAIAFHRPGPRSDTDNANATCKVPLDALTRVGIITDDGPNHIHLAPTSTIPCARGKSFTRICIDIATNGGTSE